MVWENDRRDDSGAQLPEEKARRLIDAQLKRPDGRRTQRICAIPRASAPPKGVILQSRSGQRMRRPVRVCVRVRAN